MIFRHMENILDWKTKNQMFTRIFFNPNQQPIQILRICLNFIPYLQFWCVFQIVCCFFPNFLRFFIHFTLFSLILGTKNFWPSRDTRFFERILCDGRENFVEYLWLILFFWKPKYSFCGKMGGNKFKMWIWLQSKRFEVIQQSSAVTNTNLNNQADTVSN